MKIEKININELTPYKNNAKIHTEEQIGQIVKSIEMYGNNDPIAVWGEDNIIVEGHGRYLALQKLGVDEVEIIRLDHLTNEQRKEYTLVHNKLTMNTDFDFETLERELEGLTFDDFDFGFDLPEYDDNYAEAPDSFKEYGEELEANHVCPRCGYEWN